jgi:hypothetical protein
MSNRGCTVRVSITKDGVRREYSVRPLWAEALPSPFVAGFSLSYPGKTYAVMVAADGAVNCTCPQWGKAESCKHEQALTAAGLLPVRFVQLLAEREASLNKADAELKRIAEAAIEEQMIYQHDMREAQDRIAELEASLAAVSERCAQLQTAHAAAVAVPKRSRRRKAA